MEEEERYEYYLGTNNIKDNKTNKIYYDVNVITEKMKQMFPKPLEKMYYNEIIDAIKKDKKYGFKHIALKIMVDGLEEHNREHQKYIDLQKEYFVLKHKV